MYVISGVILILVGGCGLIGAIRYSRIFLDIVRICIRSAEFSLYK
jgi:hypothetical protein